MFAQLRSACRRTARPPLLRDLRRTRNLYYWITYGLLTFLSASWTSGPPDRLVCLSVCLSVCRHRRHLRGFIIFSAGSEHVRRFLLDPAVCLFHCLHVGYINDATGGGIIFRRCTSGGVYVPCIYTHARWESPWATEVFVVILVWRISSVINSLVLWTESYEILE